MNTTKLGEVLRGKAFTWGKIHEFYHIGNYDIARYTDREGNENLFHCWIDGIDGHNCFHSLDEAILFCIVRKHEGCNSQANTYFARALGICSYEKGK
jgi:hypothetical protein